jgi:hypothetical protein
MYYILDNGIIINSMGRVVVVGQDNGLRRIIGRWWYARTNNTI